MASITHTLELFNPPDYAEWMKTRRDKLGLTQQALADAAQISLSTVKCLERARPATSCPRPRTHAALVAVLGSNCPEAIHPRPGSGIRVYHAVHYCPMDDLDRLRVALQGPGCEVEPRMLYVDPDGARAWLAACSQRPYAAAKRESLPLRQVAEIIIGSVGALALSVIALGSGDAQSETRLCQHLIDRRGGGNSIVLCLLDYSQLLMSVGSSFSRDRLQPQGVEVSGIAADFLRLGDCVEAWSAPGPRCRIFTLLGWTLGNQADEVSLLETIARCALPGDYLVFDFTEAYAPADRVDLVQQADPALNNPLPPNLADWMRLPVLRYGPPGIEVTMTTELGPLSPIPGSYEVRCVGKARVEGRDRSYLLTRAKRYDPQQLGRALRGLGWEVICHLSLEGDRRPDAMMVARRLG